jgi:hypothetical protein
MDSEAPASLLDFFSQQALRVPIDGKRSACFAIF